MSDLNALSSLIKSRNTIDGKLATIIGKSAQIGNMGEYIASIIFEIALDGTGKARGYDGRFIRGPLARQSVDVQWRVRRDGQLNIKIDAIPDYYLVFTGPTTCTPPFASPWLIETIFLFHGIELHTALRERGVQIGNSTSVTGPLWERTEIYPIPRNPALILTDEQRKQLILFG